MPPFHLENRIEPKQYADFIGCMIPSLNPAEPAAVTTSGLRAGNETGETLTLLMPEHFALGLLRDAGNAFLRCGFVEATELLRDALGMSGWVSEDAKVAKCRLLAMLGNTLLLLSRPDEAEACFVELYDMACELRRADLLTTGSRGKSLCGCRRMPISQQAA